MGCVSSNSAADDAAPVSKNPVSAGGNRKTSDVSGIITHQLTYLLTYLITPLITHSLFY